MDYNYSDTHTMQTSLSHLPEHKQEELAALAKTITETVPAEMIILFGSHARGDWVEDYQENTEYVSDYDILIMTKDHKSAKDGEKWWDLRKKLKADQEYLDERVTLLRDLTERICKEQIAELLSN